MACGSPIGSAGGVYALTSLLTKIAISVITLLATAVATAATGLTLDLGNLTAELLSDNRVAVRIPVTSNSSGGMVKRCGRSIAGEM